MAHVAYQLNYGVPVGEQIPKRIIAKVHQEGKQLYLVEWAVSLYLFIYLFIYLFSE